MNFADRVRVAKKEWAERYGKLASDFRGGKVTKHEFEETLYGLASDVFGQLVPHIETFLDKVQFLAFIGRARMNLMQSLKNEPHNEKMRGDRAASVPHRGQVT